MKRNWKKCLKSRSMVWTLLFCLAAGAVAGTLYQSTQSKEIQKQAASGKKQGNAADNVAGNQQKTADSASDDNAEAIFAKVDTKELEKQTAKEAGKADSNAADLKTAEDHQTENAQNTEKDKQNAQNTEKDNQIAQNAEQDEKNGQNTEKDGKAKQNTGEDEKSSQKTAKKDETTADTLEEAAPVSAVIQAKNLDFLSNSTLRWPVEGEVLLEFNMDETIYFPTLNLYQCNQAMVIQAEEGTPVCAPAEGVVVSIGSDEQIGNYMVLDLGDGYQVQMGQLKDIQVKEDELVNEGELLAYVAEPTTSYSLEGDNLYLSLTANGEPADPLDYLKYE